MEWLHIVNVRTDAIQALVGRDIERARTVAARAGRTAEELWGRADARGDVYEALRYMKTAVCLSSVSHALGREIAYRHPTHPCCV